MRTRCGAGEASRFPSVVCVSQGVVCVGTIFFTVCVCVCVCVCEVCVRCLMWCEFRWVQTTSRLAAGLPCSR